MWPACLCFFAASVHPAIPLQRWSLTAFPEEKSPNVLCSCGFCTIINAADFPLFHPFTLCSYREQRKSLFSATACSGVGLWYGAASIGHSRQIGAAVKYVGKRFGLPSQRLVAAGTGRSPGAGGMVSGFVCSLRSPSLVWRHGALGLAVKRSGKNEPLRLCGNARAGGHPHILQREGRIKRINGSARTVTAPPPEKIITHSGHLWPAPIPKTPPVQC